MKKVALASALAIMVATGPVHAQSFSSIGFNIGSGGGTMPYQITGTPGSYPGGDGGDALQASMNPTTVGSDGVVTGGAGGNGNPGGSGGRGIVSNGFTVNTGGSVTGGVGGSGTGGTSAVSGSAGGNGGDGLAGTGFTVVNSAVSSTANPVTGITGGAGGDGGVGGSQGGTGGAGGNGGAGINSTEFTATNIAGATITGGVGGNGGGALGGNGGDGGNGGNGVTGSGFTLTNTGTITGGAGGIGSSGNAGGDQEVVNSGKGGGGGNGISGSNITVVNTGDIYGGSGSNGGTGDRTQNPYVSGGNGGNGGAGISGSDITVVNGGNIKGGDGGSGGAGDTINVGYHGVIGTNGVDGNGGAGIQILGGTTTITNSGTITGGNGGGTTGLSGAGIDIASGSTVSIANFGTIVGGTGAVGIKNAGTITSLTNLQGAGNPAGALTYSGTLANNYNIDIVSKNTYGQLNVIGGSTAGTMHFAINPGSTVAKGTYRDVLQGFSSLSNVTGNTPGYKGFASLDLGKGTGGYNGYNYYLVPDASSPGSYNLVFGPGTYSTQLSLVNTAGALRNAYASRNAGLVNSFSYDCNLFGDNDICVSAGGRRTTVSPDGLNDSALVLIGAYRVNKNVRVGGWIERSTSSTGGGVNLSNNTPSVGLFGAWNEKQDGTGTEVKVSASTGSSNATVTRGVVGTSEAGTGGSTLNSRGAQVTAKYGVEVVNDVIVAPYVGVRYTQNNMSGYTETTSAAVTAPLTYSALNTNATTAVAGVGASYKVTPKAAVFGSAGVESDVRATNGTYTATGIAGLAPINFNASPVKTRPTAMVGASYDVAKNQRVAVTGTYRQEAFQNVSSKTVFVNYTIGF